MLEVIVPVCGAFGLSVSKKWTETMYRRLIRYRVCVCVCVCVHHINRSGPNFIVIRLKNPSVFRGEMV